MITMRVKSMFFDRANVQGMMDEATLKALSKAGAYIRRSARSSLRRRKKTSAPGSPPSVHSDDPVVTLKNILFYYDQPTKSVVIGPLALNSAIARQRSSSTVPQLQEFGGTATRKRGRGFDPQKRVQVLTYPARPFMGPALERETAKIPSFWKGSIRGSF